MSIKIPSKYRSMKLERKREMCYAITRSINDHIGLSESPVDQIIER